MVVRPGRQTPAISVATKAMNPAAIHNQMRSVLRPETATVPSPRKCALADPAQKIVTDLGRALRPVPDFGLADGHIGPLQATYRLANDAGWTAGAFAADDIFAVAALPLAAVGAHGLDIDGEIAHCCVTFLLQLNRDGALHEETDWRSSPRSPLLVAVG